jgi:transcriptional regulator with XRE-family HTH domain
MSRSAQFHSQSALDAGKRFGERLRRARKAQGRTLADLELSSRIHRQTLARLERGDPTVSIGVVLTALESLGELADIELLVGNPDLVRPRPTNDLEPLDRDF